MKKENLIYTDEHEVQLLKNAVNSMLELYDSLLPEIIEILPEGIDSKELENLLKLREINERKVEDRILEYIYNDNPTFKALNFETIRNHVNITPEIIRLAKILSNRIAMNLTVRNLNPDTFTLVANKMEINKAEMQRQINQFDFYAQTENQILMAKKLNNICQSLNENYPKSKDTYMHLKGIFFDASLMKFIPDYRYILSQE